MRVYENVELARREILARRSLDEAAVPPAVWDRTVAAVGTVSTPREAVERVLASVRAEGDAALRRFTLAFDGVAIDDFQVPARELEAAVARIPSALRSALEVAAHQVRRFHERTRRQSWVEFADGGALGQLVRPLERVGILAPGGRAPYPSSVIMAAVPARVAGVGQVVMATPPGRDGRVPDVLLAAARIAGVDAVYRVGGAQAVAALAYGTQSIPRVDKIVGPGNLFVVLAKRAVYGSVAIDGLPGPTECLVVADESARPRWLAADLLAQAEHDPMSQPVLLCTSRQVVEATLTELERLLEVAHRAPIARESISHRGAAVLVGSVEEAIDFANDYAPEHLCLAVREAWRYLELVRNAGGVFVGEESVESLGDYTAGPTHVMPTGGTARFSSPLNLDDFVKITSLFSFGPEAVRRLGPPAIELAVAEGLEAHADAIRLRLEAAPRGRDST